MASRLSLPPASSFYYLTGLEEPDAVASSGRPRAAVRLLVRPYDPRPPSGTARACVEGLPPSSAPERRLPDRRAGGATAEAAGQGTNRRLLRSAATSASNADLPHRRRAARRSAARGPAVERLIDLPAVDALRRSRPARRIAALQARIDSPAAGIEAAMRATRPGCTSTEVQAVLEAEFRRLGSPRRRFPRSSRRRELLHPALHRQRAPIATATCCCSTWARGGLLRAET